MNKYLAAYLAAAAVVAALDRLWLGAAAMQWVARPSSTAQARPDPI